MTWIRDRSRVFRLESVVGWQWDHPTLPSGTKRHELLVVWLPGHALAFQSPDAEKIEALLLGDPTVPVIRPCTPPSVLERTE